MFWSKQQDKELVVVTTYFNPSGYKTRKKNFDVFLQGISAVNVRCLTVECAFGDSPFELDPEEYDVLQIRADSVLWQKERLLNLAAQSLPSHYKYVAWLDADIVFKNKNWVRDLKTVMQIHKIAQTWQSCERMSKSGKSYPLPDWAWSFGHVMGQDPSLLNKQRYDAHGHTGYGWVMHRSIFDKLGLYDAAVSGSADHFMAHAVYGNYNHCIVNALKGDPAQIKHLQEWGAEFYKLAGGSVGVVPGHIEHLWHGEPENRRYFLRMHDITDLGFNPCTDISRRPGMPLEWSCACESKQGLKNYFVNYFESRQED